MNFYPLALRLLNTAGNYLLIDRFSPFCLEEDVLYETAIAKTGLDDFGDAYYREGFQQLLNSAQQDANLNLVGRLAMRGTISDNLVNRLLLIEARKRQPERFAPLSLPPIIILGLPRSGTTFLHRLLAEDPAHRALSLLEVSDPLSRHDSPRRRQTAKKLNDFSKFIPDLDVKHYSRADSPEECMYLLGTTFVSLIFWTIAPIYGYLDWYNGCNRLPAYQEYHWLLQVLQTVDPTCRLTLKAPAHFGSLNALRQTLPHALLIQTHRHPVVAYNSFNSLIYSLQKVTTQNLDLPKFAEANLALLENEISLGLAARDPNAVFDVFYDSLVADPINTVKGIYDHFGFTWSAAYEARLATYLQNNPQGKHGKHQYHAADFGQTNGAIAARFTDYCERFGFKTNPQGQNP